MTATCRAGLWLCASWLYACSGSTTDVVGVLDPELTDVVGSRAEGEGVQSLERVGGFDTDVAEFLLVAGLPLRDWQGPTVQWPLATPLRQFFSASSWPGGSGPPEHVEREAFERMGVFAEKRRDDVRFAAPRGGAAERLRELFSAVPDGPRGEAPSLVTRDRYDEYLVVLGSASCARASSHHGGPCPDFTSDQPDDL